MKTKEKKRKNYITIGEFLRRTKGKRVAAALGLAVMLGMMGCAGKDDTSGTSQEKTSKEADMEKDASERQEEPDGGAEDGEKEDAPMQEGEWEKEEPVLAQGKKPGESEEGGEEAAKDRETAKASAGDGQAVTVSQETEHLSGKVQEPTVDGMMLAQTTLVDEDGMVTLLEVDEAKKIPVRFTQDTKVEHWMIQGGGAGIDMRDAAVSDLEEGMGVELEGYFEGETFVAARVIMEEDV